MSSYYDIDAILTDAQVRRPTSPSAGFQASNASHRRFPARSSLPCPVWVTLTEMPVRM